MNGNTIKFFIIITSCSITTIIIVAPGRKTVNKYFTLTVNSNHKSQSSIYHVKRSADIAINIQRGHFTSRALIDQPRSLFEVSMNLGTLSEIDYTERIDL